jgi:hypothetical protein
VEAIAGASLDRTAQQYSRHAVGAQFAEVQVLVPNDARTSNPLGAKGIGEPPMVGGAAAIANAVYHATGQRLCKCQSASRTC